MRTKTKVKSRPNYVRVDSIPIKDKNLLEQIKDKYKEIGEYRGLLLFLLGINTGIKLLRLLELRVGDVKNKDILTIIEPSSGEILSYILTDEIKSIVPLVVGDRKKSEYLFISKWDKPLDRTTVHGQFKNICKELKVDNSYSAASWRKTFAYHYYKLTGDIAKIMLLFHHNSVEQTYKFIDEDQNITLNLDRRFAL